MTRRAIAQICGAIALLIFIVDDGDNFFYDLTAAVCIAIVAFILLAEKVYERHMPVIVLSVKSPSQLSRPMRNYVAGVLILAGILILFLAGAFIPFVASFLGKCQIC